MFKNELSALHGAFEKVPFCGSDPLFVCVCMVGRKPLSHLHRGLLCTLEQTITAMFSPQIYDTVTAVKWIRDLVLSSQMKWRGPRFLLITSCLLFQL